MDLASQNFFFVQLPGAMGFLEHQSKIFHDMMGWESWRSTPCFELDGNMINNIGHWDILIMTDTSDKIDEQKNDEDIGDSISSKILEIVFDVPKKPRHVLPTPEEQKRYIMNYGNTVSHEIRVKLTQIVYHSSSNELVKMCNVGAAINIDKLPVDLTEELYILIHKEITTAHGRL